MLPVVPDRADAGAVALDRVGELGPMAGVELGGLVDEDNRASVDVDRAGLSSDFELLDGQRRCLAAELLSHPPGSGAVHRARDHPPPSRPVGLRSRVQDWTLPGPRPAGEARPPRAAGKQLDGLALLGVQMPALAERALSGPKPQVALSPPDRRHPVALSRRRHSDVHHVLLELADLARGHPAALEREQLAALGAFHPRQQPCRLLSGEPAGGGLEHKRAGARDADRGALLAQLREHHLARLAHPRLELLDLPFLVAQAASRAGTEAMLLAKRVPHLPKPVGVEVAVFGLAGLLRENRQRAAPQSDPELSLDLRARLGNLARARRHHLAQPGRDALHLEVAPPVTSAGPDRPPGVDECVRDLGAEQRAALQRGVVAKPLPRVGRHQPPISPHNPDHEVVHVQLRRRRPDRRAPAARSRAARTRPPPPPLAP